MLWQSQLLPWPPPSKKKPHACAHAKEAILGHDGAGGRKGGRKKGMLGGRVVRQLRPSGNKRANAQWAGDGQRYRIADTVWGGYVGAQITIKRLHVAWDAHPVAVMPAVHSIIRHVSPLDAFVDVPSQFQRAGGRTDGRRLIILFCRPPFPLSERFCCPCRKASIRSGDENGTKTAV